MNNDVVRRTVRRAVIVTLVTGTLIGCGGSDGNNQTDRCQRIREHLVELEISSDRSGTLENHRETLTRALGDEFVARCASEMDEERVGCLLTAGDSGSAAACSAQSTR